MPTQSPSTAARHAAARRPEMAILRCHATPFTPPRSPAGSRAAHYSGYATTCRTECLIISAAFMFFFMTRADAFEFTYAGFLKTMPVRSRAARCLIIFCCAALTFTFSFRPRQPRLSRRHFITTLVVMPPRDYSAMIPHAADYAETPLASDAKSRTRRHVYSRLIYAHGRMQRKNAAVRARRASLQRHDEHVVFEQSRWRRLLRMPHAYRQPPAWRCRPPTHGFSARPAARRFGLAMVSLPSYFARRHAAHFSSYVCIVVVALQRPITPFR